MLLDNHGFSSIDGLSQAIGSGDFGTWYRRRNPESGELDGAVLPIDFAANAASLGAHSIRATTREDLRKALEDSRRQDRTTVIVVVVDGEERVPGYAAWWDVPVAEASETDTVRRAQAEYERARSRERYYP